MNNPKISVIVAVYNTEKYLRQSIDSILSQTFTDFEVILVDDCSPDNCPKMCDEYEKQDRRIKVIHHKTNQGSIVTYRDGINCATGDYIQFVDSDDWIEPDSMERLYGRAVSEGSDIVYCDVIRFTDSGKLSPDFPFDTRGMDKRDIVISMIEEKIPQYMPNKLFKKNLFDNMVWPDFQLREDTVICIQLFLNAEKISYEYSTLYHYRFNEKSISSNNRNRYRLLNEIYENFRKLESILKSRSDYDFYCPAITKALKKFKTNDRFRLYYYIKRFFMAFIPSGMVFLYRSYACYSFTKFLSTFVPYGIIMMYKSLKPRKK